MNLYTFTRKLISGTFKIQITNAQSVPAEERQQQTMRNAISEYIWSLKVSKIDTDYSIKWKIISKVNSNFYQEIQLIVRVKCFL